ncbi:MAG: hypothetical protein HOW97_34380 [Catenulispora sp.]|nr:hypothetical protein [Catenulispora sp.]
MRRWRTAAVAAVVSAVALVAGACGVQPTGVNIATTSPFSVSKAEGTSPTSAPGTDPYQVKIFLMPKTNGSAILVTRWIDKKPATAIDLLPQLWDTNIRESEAENLTTYVNPDFTLVQTKNAHEYVIEGAEPSANALIQLTCTFDAWWRDHRDGTSEASTQFRYQGAVISTWDDCASLLGPDPSPAGKPRPGAVPSTYGN